MQGNSDVLTANVTGKMMRASRRDRTTVYFTSLFNRDSGDESSGSANAIRSGIRYDFNVTKRLFSFGFADFDRDALEDLNFRNVLGGGVGWKVKNSHDVIFNVFSGGTFNQEYFSSTPDRKTAEILVGEELNYKLCKRSVLDERLAMFPNLSDPGEYRSSFDPTSSTKLSEWLNWEVSVSDRLLSNPAPSTKRNDLIITTGIGISFGQSNPFEPAVSFVKLLTEPEN